jgi:hypothetical protein
MISVFKTSVKTERDISNLKPCLNELLPQAKWNFDLEDCDKIFRIDGQREISESVIKLLQNNGFACEELTD